MKEKIAVIGERESVMLFKAVGMEVHYAKNNDEVEEALHFLAKEGCPIIYITEKAYQEASEAIALYDNQIVPAIIPIPDKDGVKGIGLAGLKKNVEKAIGADILFGEGR